MTRIFTDKTIAELNDRLHSLGSRTDQTVLRYTYYTYKSPRAQEFAHQGFVRRVRILERCIQNVFELIPPDTFERLPPSIISDAQINIQAFIANAYGAVDNLAWVWAHETGLADKIDRKKVGLRSHNVEVRKSLSLGMQAYLANLDPWFAYVVDYRDSLAHRIPLYIPERVRPEDVTAYNGLTAQMTEAMNNLDAAAYERFRAEQDQLLEFQPFITHSVAETNAQVAFHGQMLVDFVTVEELGKKMLSEIKAVR